MRKLLQLAATLLLIGATATHAQITSPDKLVAPLPRNPARPHPPQAADDYQWLWQYSGKKQALLADPRFNVLLKDNLKAPQAFWSTPGSPLADAAQTFLSGDGTVASADNRHLTITGCVVDHCPQRGELWIDLGEPDPLVIFLALRWNEQAHTTDEPDAPFTLWLFPSRLVDAHRLSQAVKDTISAFAGSGGCNAPKVTNTIVVDPSGVPHLIGALESGVPIPFCNSNPTAPASTHS